MTNLTFQEWFDREVKGLPEEEIRKPESEAELFTKLEALMPDPQLCSDPLITCLCYICKHKFKINHFYGMSNAQCPKCKSRVVSKSIV